MEQIWVTFNCSVNIALAALYSYKVSENVYV